MKDNGLPEGYCSPDEFSKLISKEKHNELRRRVGRAAKKYQVGFSINKDCSWTNGAGWEKTGVRGMATDEDCLSKDLIFKCKEKNRVRSRPPYPKKFRN